MHSGRRLTQHNREEEGIEKHGQIFQLHNGHYTVLPGYCDTVKTRENCHNKKIVTIIDDFTV